MTLLSVEKEDGCVFWVRIAPGGGCNEVIGKHGDAIRIRVKAAMGEGANEALRDFLAGRLGVSRQSVAILSGRTSRWKQIRVRGVAADAVRSLLP